jgi:UDP-N-acetyl-D-galactosamine dehydrogenase
MTSIKLLREKKAGICVVGLGYVGLPLAVLLARRFRVSGFDRDPGRIKELKSGADRTGEVDEAGIMGSGVEFSDNPAIIGESGLVIVTVPTPIDDMKLPDLSALKGATGIVGENMKRGTVVVYESTVYPGATEDECVPLLEEKSGLAWKKDFGVGYSPERVNPGDKEHTIEKIVKVVSGDTPETLEFLAGAYGDVVTAGVHEAPSIRVAEAAKVIENTQRDLNIALMNELAMLFGRMDIDTRDVLEAAYTKWNFIRFEPGLVGGHCIGVDPYYLTYRSQKMGFDPRVILSGRSINDSMGRYVAESTVSALEAAGRKAEGSRALLLGLTFKENVPDIRNSGAVEIRAGLMEHGLEVDVHDPHASAEEARDLYGIELLDEAGSGAPYDAIVVAVRHRAILESMDITGLFALAGGQGSVLADVKGAYDRESARKQGFNYWRL